MRILLYKVALKHKKVIIHTSCWLIFCAYESALAGLVTGVSVPLVHYIPFYLINILLFYFHSYFLLNHAKNFKINLWRIPLILILEFSVYILINLVISFLLNKYLYKYPGVRFMNYNYLPTVAYRGVYFILYSTGYYFLMNYIRKTENALRQTLQNEQLTNQILRVEQDFLRAQVNPHLLFNTLNFIKYAAKKKPEEADEAVMRLSGIMSFALEHNAETISLTKELEQVENIIGLSQLRHNHTLHVKLIKNLENEEVTLLPIILLTLVENIFKHGYLLDEEHPAIIKVESTSAYLLILTSNLTHERPNIESHNTGLINIHSRLESYYKGKYEFNVKRENNMFIVHLKIDLL